MRVLLVIFALHISYVFTDDGNYGIKKAPKKVKMGSGKMVINLGKFADNTDTKNYASYTRFPIVNQGNVSKRFFFPVDDVTKKTRVKKVLSEYPSQYMIRSKRSVETPKPNIEASPAKPLEETKSTTKHASQSLTTTLNTGSRRVNSVAPKPVKTETKVARSPGMLPKGRFKANKPSMIRNPVKTIKKVKRTNGRSAKTKGKNIQAKRTLKKRLLRDTKAKNKLKSKVPGRTLSKKSKLRGMPRTGLRKKKAKRIRTGVRNPNLNEGIKRQRKLRSPLRKKPRYTSRVMRNKKSLQKRKLKRSGKKRALRKRRVPKGKFPTETRRLTGAREAPIEDYPYMVSIQKNGQHWCSGALLNPRLVITTANCVWKSKRISRMEVRAGSSYTDRGGQVVGIQQVRKHPGWGLRKNPDNDVALLLLEEKIRFSHSVHGVDLPNHAMLPTFDDAWVTSWGAERRDGIFEDIENHMQVYHAMLMSNELCNNITTRFGVIVTDNFICLSQTGKNSPCTRDTGAPAVSDGVLWGLASWGLRKLCGTERYPSMFSYIASHSNMDFIANATTDLMADERLSPFKDRPPMMRARKPLEKPRAEEIVIGPGQ